MKGHTNNRVLLAHLKSAYRSAKKEVEWRNTSDEAEERQYFEGMASQCVETGILMEVIEGENDLKIL